ncbi:MAG: cobyrinate a,c-diamide synthase [Okeania sp. SIO2C9]|uniref:cobyrinate a,c-diamide synthase n=1 Tax=Okeania sp. SIO2C9 TaxID=2607791 RepID=UPI0013C1FDE4|nr:cobyrinate a,c-diamide synthase [Okeania sp. SIO2C9]NEQ77371.1 cobyrinate a,c-diamide synthase [Okeania sp. SIO2C9]
MSLIVAGERSGVGKTTVTLALLSYLKWQNLQVQSFKVGPDYIDPMFHQYVTGKSCRNLDPMLTSEVYVQQCFARNIQDVDFALVEGVMGLFDGVSFNPHSPPLQREVEDEYDSILLKKGEKDDGDGCFPNFVFNPPCPPLERGVEDESDTCFPDFASTAHISRLLNVPVLLVLDCSRLSASVAAIAHGLISFDPTINFAGLILNRVGSDRHLQLLQNSLKFINLPVLGVLRRHQNITIPDRHLGLLPTDEMPDLDYLINDLADLAKTCFDWEKLLPLLKIQNEEYQHFLSRQILPNNTIHFSLSNVKNVEKKKSEFLIGVARDRAFNFYYQDNLDILEELGAKIVFWSPLKDENLPAGVEGLYFGGGFPEVFAQQLSENILMRKAVEKAIISGMPTYAECGGLMYLSQAIIDFNSKSWKMVGILPTTAVMGKNLKLGYRQAITNIDTPLLAANTQVYGHEFHRSELTEVPERHLYKMWRIDEDKNRSKATVEGWKFYQLHASYLHIHWGSRVDIPQRFINYLEEGRSKKEEGKRKD